MAAPAESRAGAKANHLMIRAAPTCFRCADLLPHKLIGGVSISFLSFFFRSLQNVKVSLCFFVFLARCWGAEQTTLHRHRCSLVALQARMMPGFHGDGGAKRSRRPVCTAFPSFCLPRRLGFWTGTSGGLRRNRSIQAGTHQTGWWIPPPELLQGVFVFFTNRDGKVKGRQLQGTFCVSVRVHKCARARFTFFSMEQKQRWKKHRISNKNIMLA